MLSASLFIRIIICSLTTRLPAQLWQTLWSLILSFRYFTSLIITVLINSLVTHHTKEEVDRAPDCCSEINLSFSMLYIWSEPWQSLKILGVVLYSWQGRSAYLHGSHHEQNISFLHHMFDFEDCEQLSSPSPLQNIVVSPMVCQSLLSPFKCLFLTFPLVLSIFSAKQNNFMVESVT